MGTIQYGEGSAAALLGNASQTVQLDTLAPVGVEFHTHDKRVMDMEIRVVFAQLPQIPPDYIFAAPVIRWNLQIGHGESTIEQIAQTLPVMPGARASFGGEVPHGVWPEIPGRGLHFRVTGRGAKLLLQNAGWNSEGYHTRDTYGDYLDEFGAPNLPSFPTVLMAVSMQPVVGLDVAVAPRSIVYDPQNTYAIPVFGNFVQIPSAASELRVSDYNGEPIGAFDAMLDPETYVLRFLDPTGFEVYTVSPAALSDWRPIPHQAWCLHRPTSGNANKFRVEFR
jgi:hypothetical protein